MDPNIIIDRLGGTVKTAELCELSKGAVSQWRTNGIPSPWLKFLRATHPEVFAETWPPEEEGEPLLAASAEPAAPSVEPGYPQPVHDDRRAVERRDGDRRVRGEQRQSDRREIDRRDGV